MVRNIDLGIIIIGEIWIDHRGPVSTLYVFYIQSNSEIDVLEKNVPSHIHIPFHIGHVNIFAWKFYVNKQIFKNI